MATKPAMIKVNNQEKKYKIKGFNKWQKSKLNSTLVDTELQGLTCLKKRMGFDITLDKDFFDDSSGSFKKNYEKLPDSIWPHTIYKQVKFGTLLKEPEKENDINFWRGYAKDFESAGDALLQSYLELSYNYDFLYSLSKLIVNEGLDLEKIKVLLLIEKTDGMGLTCNEFYDYIRGTPVTKGNFTLKIDDENKVNLGRNKIIKIMGELEGEYIKKRKLRGKLKRRGSRKRGKWGRPKNLDELKSPINPEELDKNQQRLRGPIPSEYCLLKNSPIRGLMSHTEEKWMELWEFDRTFYSNPLKKLRLFQ